MKKICILSTLLLVSAILSGCACQHEWTEAGCLNPQICSKCEEISGDALGHDWIPAVCTSPETCSRCGETNGSPTEHRFGDWIPDDTQMTRICEECGLEETAELSQEMHLDMLLRGYWEITALVKTQEQEFYSADVFNSIVGEYLQFEEGQTLSGIINQEAFVGTWQFFRHEKTDNNDIYIFKAIDENGRDLEMHLTHTGQQKVLSVFFGNGVRILLACYDEITDEITGTWTTGSDHGYTLQFRDDHTVSCNLGDEFEATWHLTSKQEAGSLAYNNIYIFKDDGSIIEGAVIFSSPDVKSPYCISLNWNEENTPNISTKFMTHTKE